MLYIFRLLIICLVVFAVEESGASPITSMLTSASADDCNFTLEVKIEDGWGVYGPYVGQDGRPLEVSTSGSENLTKLDIKWPQPDYEEGNNLYHGKVVIPVVAFPKDKEKPINLNLTLNMVACNDVCLRLVQQVSAIGYALDSHYSSMYIIKMIFLAVLGGFILNLMPCVLPIITLKIYALARYAGRSSLEVRKMAASTVLGVVVSFLTLALFTIGIKEAGGYLSWGFHFQNPAFLAFLTVVMFVSALALRGDVDFLNEVKWMGGNDSIASFIVGSLTTLLATSCTTPLITPVLTFALTQKSIIIVLLYGAIGIGMAIPFIVISIHPRSSMVLPKPGPWMDNLRNGFSVLILLTVLWLLYILGNQCGLVSALLVGGGLILLKFTLTYFKLWLRLILVLMMVVFIVSIPKAMQQRNVIRTQLVDSYWDVFSEAKLNEYRDRGDLVLVDVTAEWCLMCKVNKLLVTNNLAMLEFLQLHNVKMLRADLTNSSKEVMNYMEKSGQSAIPFNVIYGPKPPYQVILSTFLTTDELKNTLHRLKN